VTQRDLSEPRIPRRKLRQVLGHPIVDASDQALVDRDPDENRDERLRGRERGLQALASRAVEVALVSEAIVVNDEEREGLRVAQELVESPPFNAHNEVGLDAGAKRTRVSTRRYPPRRESVLVAHVRLPPHQRPGKRGVVGR
jgi:hypothetical protein